MRDCCLLAFVALLLSTTLSRVGAQDTKAASLIDLGTRRFGDDWPQFLGPTGDSKSTETGILTDWSNGSLRVVWEQPLIESYGICSVSRGRVFQFDSVFRDGMQVGLLSCLNSETGAPLWKYEYDYRYRDPYGYNNGPRTSPLVDGDRVYGYGVDGTLFCVAANDGHEIWRLDVNRRFGVVQNFFGVGSNPVIFEDLLLVMVGGSPAGTSGVGDARGNGSGIVAFDKFTGEVRYKRSDELASYASLKLVRSPTRAWCFALMRGGLLTFEPRRGSVDFFFPWRAKILESVNASVPVVSGDQVFISETYGPGSAFLNYTQAPPKVVWQDAERSRTKAMQTHWNTAVEHDGFLYGSSGRHTANAELRCIDASTGSVMWSKPGLTRSSLLYVDGHFVCLSEDGMLRLIEVTPTEYREVSKVALSKDGQTLLQYPAWSAPILARGLLYVRGKDRLVCVELIRTSK